MPIKTSLNQASKIIQDAKVKKSLSLVVSVASEEELAGLNIALDPVTRQDWEENEEHSNFTEMRNPRRNLT